MAMNLRNELNAVNKELKVITKKVEKIIIAADKIEKPKAVKKASAKKPPVQKAKKLSAIDAVLGVVKRSRKKIDIETLKDKTGFEGGPVIAIPVMVEHVFRQLPPEPLNRIRFGRIRRRPDWDDA